MLLDASFFFGLGLGLATILERSRDILIDIFTQALPVILLELAFLIDPLLALFFTQAALLIPLLPLLILLRSHLHLASLFLFSFIFRRLLFGFGGNDAFQVDDSLLEPMNFGLEALKLPVHLEGLLVLFLPL